MELGLKPEGHITIELRNADGVERLEFDNLVTDSGWSAFLARTTVNADSALVPKFLRFGLGDEEPTLGDTALHQSLPLIRGHTSIVYGGLVDAGKLTAYSSATVRFDFAPGELSGHRLTELGLSYNADGTDLYNRALIRDENAVPTPLVCLSDQEVVVYVRLRLYLTGWTEPVQLGPYSGTIQMNSGGAQSTTANMWVKGLPTAKVVIGNQTAIALTPDAPRYEHYLFHGPYTTWWSASLITFYGRDNASFLSVSIPQPYITLGPDLVMGWRITIQFQRADV